jgi:DNA-binding transcriptional ArsR family regulator
LSGCDRRTRGDMKKNSATTNGDYERQALIFKALANPTRLQLVDLLGKKERWAWELQEGLGISKANLSQHLSILRAAGVVSTQREGKQLYCGIALPEVKAATATLRTMTKAVSRANRRQSF